MVPFPFEMVPFVGGSFQCRWLECISFPASEANLPKARQESLKQCFRSSMEEIKVRVNLTQGFSVWNLQESHVRAMKKNRVV